VGQAEDLDGLLRSVQLERPEAAVVDIRMPPTHTDEGFVAAQRIRTDAAILVDALRRIAQGECVIDPVRHRADGRGPHQTDLREAGPRTDPTSNRRVLAVLAFLRSPNT
jgi:serine/threonine-protein kinase